MKSTRRLFDAIVTVQSWEPRFVLGIKQTLKECTAKRMLAYFIGEYRGRTRKVQSELRKLTDEAEVVLQEKEVSFHEPSSAWATIERDIGPSTRFENPVLVDLTTMPREIIWSTLFWLEAGGTKTDYVYRRPDTYGKDWLARDPNNPRLVYKLAGTLEIGRRTALVAVTGFDEERCRQAVEFYEPTRVLLATQTGRQYGNDTRNVVPDFQARRIKVNEIQVDTFGADHGYEALRPEVADLAKEHNVILCSFGPKPSAVALFRLQREFPQCALAYIGCKEYNQDYSRGMGDAVRGSIFWRKD